uniref:Uncharacterized protein n=2 Tax=Panagrolaimus sp. ES5 TaxID=591445 RepID=A0AC34GJ54_9BILA
MVVAGLTSPENTFTLKSSDNAKIVKQRIDEYLYKQIPTMPIQIKEWVRDLLVENEDEIYSVEELADAVGEHIYGSNKDITRETVLRICEKLFELLHQGKTIENRREDAAR